MPSVTQIRARYKDTDTMRPDALLVNPIPITFQLRNEFTDFATSSDFPRWQAPDPTPSRAS